ncbi:hypothetical protein CCYA_CCYA19G4662 [Cyanidiococcus yangmingshanensis]|nr:hypothetical protein CCYA_CCYA19G4662 [Cyanidiococcus yangmingshanensis]
MTGEERQEPSYKRFLGKLNFIGKPACREKESVTHSDHAPNDPILNPRTGYLGCLTNEQAKVLKAFQTRLAAEGLLPSTGLQERRKHDLNGSEDHKFTTSQSWQDGEEACGHEDALQAYLARSPENTQRVLLQYLRARDFNIDKAHALFCSTLLWRKQVRVCCIPLDANEHPAATFPFSLVPGARNHYGHRLVLGKMVRFEKQNVDREAFRAAVISFLERCCYGDLASTTDTSVEKASPWPHSTERFTVVFDLGDGFDVFHNTDLACYSDMITLIQSHYPERLGKVYIIHYSRYIHVFYRLLSPFIEEKTRAKIHWIPQTEIEQEFRRDFPIEHLPKFLGGQLE